MENSTGMSSTAHGTNVLISCEVLWCCLPCEHPYGCLGARGNRKFMEDVDGVIAHSVRTEEQSPPNLLIGLALQHKPEYPAFFLAQTESVLQSLIAKRIRSRALHCNQCCASSPKQVQPDEAPLQLIVFSLLRHFTYGKLLHSAAAPILP